MDSDELQRFNDADKIVHSVEKEWHYPVMIDAGFTPITKTQVGFVRTYHYEHPAGHKISMTTGAHADYWEHNKKSGYWSELRPYVKQLISQIN